jgi:medium-chain acyl-[acyl-carrier-protein] hydrolase
VRFGRRPAAALRLFCFPAAGGGASAYGAWADALPERVEVCGVELPGRGSRLLEPAFTRFEPLVEATSRALLAALDRPFALFGHSMGALVAFAVARRVRAAYDLVPEHLLVAGHPAPRLAPIAAASTRSPAPLDAADRRLLDEASLMRVALPAIESDLAAYATFRHEEAPPLACPIAAFGGRDDTLAPPAALAGWREETEGTFVLHLLRGGHAFVRTARASLLALVARELASPARAAA